MIKHRKYHSVSHFIAFGLYRLLPAWAQFYFLTRLPEPYLVLLDIALQGANEEIMVGYEAGWPVPMQQTYKRWS
ncbi:MAG: hypothetical protein A2010_12150 [Nitrospirae bacterium GWD2_57_9]|nr:MAG: hypothetical protein A2010_12150 [Nitrospirae bacterium GWD2_57_9]OGW51304.1 MAG: hypothetical protein A2078_09425 [Nitrospirae bacterium GWC2_57_9]